MGQKLSFLSFAVWAVAACAEGEPDSNDSEVDSAEEDIEDSDRERPTPAPRSSSELEDPVAHEHAPFDMIKCGEHFPPCPDGLVCSHAVHGICHLAEMTDD